jgi:N-succinyldiaminopimelate aminotransferase
MPARRPHLVDRLQAFGTTIFAEMSALAVSTGSINLGQGFPDADGPPAVLDAAIDAIRAGHNQYPPGDGIPELRAAIASHQEHWYRLGYDPTGEILVTAGATEAIAASILSLCEPGDEVVALEPFYDSYPACVALAGARLVGVTLRPPHFELDADALRGAVTDRTRLLLLNSPHNPTGRVLTPAELSAVADVCREHDLLVVTDEVYEHLVFDGEHVPIATLPGMRDRTVTISSGGKTFSVTGWKVGWAAAPRPLVDAVRTVKQFLTYVNGGPFQHAIASGLGLPDTYFRDAAAELASKRDLLCDGLERAGFGVSRPQGTYFVTADITPFGEGDGMAFCRSLPERAGVVAIPTGVFYDPVHAHLGRHLVRFAFCKDDAVLGEAVTRLRELS